MREKNGRFLFKIDRFDTSSVQAILAKAGYNPAEPRDDHGWWTRSEEQRQARSNYQQIQYRGYFHDIVVNHLIDNLTSRNVKAIKNVKVFGVNGILAIPDGGTLIPGQSKPYFIEVKTGFDPDLTANQKQVYPLVCAGWHAVSFDPRIRDLGLTPGQLLPPLDIMIARTYGPGLPIRAESYCKTYGFGATPDAH